MALFQSSNPVLKEETFQKASTMRLDGELMTIKGTVAKTGYLFLLLLASSAFSWGQFMRGVNIFPYLIGGVIVALILGLVITFKKEWSGFLAPAYAIAEGLFLGAVSAFYAAKYAGIVTQAVGLTFSVVIAMLLLYAFRIIRVTETFRSIMFVAIAGIGIFYLVAFGLSFFNISIPFLHEGSTFGIIFSLVVVGIASLSLLLDFDMIEKGSVGGAPKYFEWYCAFGLMVTIVWLYLEILRLLSKINSRN
ncbi:Bax inhibitor-1/YccA family protein [uncultured Chitinophaga sp.]|uniref:Bax inhibitor-1/YccA family protein n=1 Tax=uncultured Chitinophaga sp. TaxID=339340 RepID=UPI0025CCD680|nr:Bax inhibitor-1/YccA family protein [uncultured Chitinophaga sp.]